MSTPNLTANYSFSTGPFENLVSKGPGSVEVFDAQAGEPGACLNGAIKDTIFRSHIPQFWKALLPKVEKEFGLERRVDEDATAKAKAKAKNPEGVQSVKEGWNSYMKRLVASLKDDTSAIAKLNTMAAETALELEISVAPAQRGGPKIAAQFFKMADSVLALDPDSRDARIAEKLGDVDLDRDADGTPDRDKLAAAIADWASKQLF